LQRRRLDVFGRDPDDALAFVVPPAGEDAEPTIRPERCIVQDAG